MKVYLKKINQKPINFTQDELNEFISSLNPNDSIYLQYLKSKDYNETIPVYAFKDNFLTSINKYVENKVDNSLDKILVIYKIELNYFIVNLIDLSETKVASSIVHEDGEWVDTNNIEDSKFNDLINDRNVLKLGFEVWLEKNSAIPSQETQSNYVSAINTSQDKIGKDIYSIFISSEVNTLINYIVGSQELLARWTTKNVKASLNYYEKFFNSLSTGHLNLNKLSSTDATNHDEENNHLPNYYSLNLILYGAPGTGKTFNTVDYAQAIIEHENVENVQSKNREQLMKWYHNHEISLNDKGEITGGQIAFITFHQSYTYEDFIIGLKPYSDNQGNLKFKWKDGIFKKIANEASKHPNQNYVLIIDEINRANMSRVLGELITLLEKDKRTGEQNALSVILPSGENFSVPNNLYVIGTMNTADKSISNIDVALRRRFTFIEVPVSLDQLEDEREKILKTINDDLKKELDTTDLLIGQAYFMDEKKDLADILNQSVIPLLYEYFDDNQDKVEEIIKDVENIGGSKIHHIKNEYGRISVKLVNTSQE